jgi:hypothetical protein
MKVVRSLLLSTGRLYPQEFSWYSFSEAESTPGHLVRSVASEKNPQRQHWGSRLRIYSWYYFMFVFHNIWEFMVLKVNKLSFFYLLPATENFVSNADKLFARLSFSFMFKHDRQLFATI